MSFFAGTSSLLQARAATMSGRTPTRSDLLGKRYQPFANPFFDHANTYLPSDIKSLFKYCRYYFMTHGIVNAICSRASEYPITDLILQHEGSGVQERWEELLVENMNYSVQQLEVNLDYSCFGNAFVSVSFPFRKRLKCPTCNTEHDALDTRKDWRYTQNKFWLTCPKCETSGFASSRDVYISDITKITLVRWSPEFVNIHFNEATGRMDYTLQVSPQVHSYVNMGRKDIVATLPEIFLQAVKEKTAVVFDPREVFHMRRPNLSYGSRGWGVPMIMPVLKDAFYMQIMKKAQECVHPETLLDTVNGLIPAKDVDVGTVVRTHTGAYEPITALRRRPMLEERGDYAVKLSISGMREISSTFSNNHPMYVLRRNQKNRRIDTKEHRRSSYVLRNPSLYSFDWVDAGDVSVGDYVGYPISREIREHRFDLADVSTFSAVTDNWVYSQMSQATAEDFESPASSEKYSRRLKSWGKTPPRSERVLPLTDDLAYIAGWYTGDGCLGSHRSITFCMGPEDDSVDLEEAISNTFPDATFSKQSTASMGWNLTVSSPTMHRFIEWWLPGKAHTKRVPLEIQHAPDSVVAAFLRGYVESDGCVRDKNITIVTCNKELAYTTWRLALSLRCIGTISERSGYDSVITHSNGVSQEIKGSENTAYYVRWCTASRDRLLAIMSGGDPVEVVSGKSGFFLGEYFAARVHAVEHEWCDEVISIEVANEHTFCVPGMATHNSILLEHVIPQNFIFPQPAAQGVDPFTSVDLSNWKDKVRVELARQRVDPAYTAIVPFPIGHQSIGGQGRALLLMPEIQQVAEHITLGMGFPPDLMFGNGNYAGTSVSMRMVENYFLNNVSAQYRLTKWVLRRISAYLGWPIPDIKFKPFRMADDLQRQGLNLQLNQAGKLSDTTLLSSGDFDMEQEVELMSKEVGLRAESMKKQQLMSTEILGETQILQAKYQARAQVAMSKTQMEEEHKVMSSQQAAPPSLQDVMGSNILGPGGMSMDQAAGAVRYLEGKNPVDMRPMPEVLPPRREA